MECAVCQVRSSVGYCAECQTLLCDECGIHCTNCGKMVCSKHVHETRSHKRLCPACMEERKARAAERAAAAEAAADMEADGTSLEALEAPPVGEVSEEALVASVRKPPPPWKLSAITAGVGVVVMVVLLIFPYLRRIDLPGFGGVVPTPYLLMVIPTLAIVWSLIGFIGASYRMDRSKTFIGFGLAVLCIVLGVVAVRTDPAREAEAKARAMAQERRHETPQEIQARKTRILDKFK